LTAVSDGSTSVWEAFRLTVLIPQIHSLYQYLLAVKALLQALIMPREKGTGSSWIREWMGLVSDVDKMANETPVIYVPGYILTNFIKGQISS
jgi:hypothetical protein